MTDTALINQISDSIELRVVVSHPSSQILYLLLSLVDLLLHCKCGMVSRFDVLFTPFGYLISATFILLHHTANWCIKNHRSFEFRDEKFQLLGRIRTRDC